MTGAVGEEVADAVKCLAGFDSWGASGVFGTRFLVRSSAKGAKSLLYTLLALLAPRRLGT